jgi:hypothetical protein
MSLSALTKGITTIVWGDSLSANSNGAMVGAIVESGKIAPKNGAPIEIEDSQGFTAVVVFLDDGFDATLNLVYDSAKAWPNLAAKVTLSIPTWSGTANANATTYNCFVAATPEIDEGRKKEAMIAYKISYRPGLNMAAW